MKKNPVDRTVKTIIRCLKTQREPPLVFQWLRNQRECGYQSIHPANRRLYLPPQYLVQYLRLLPILTITLLPTLILTLRLILTSTLILLPLPIIGLFVPEGETTRMDQ
jgi:hypothetical protein